MVLDKALEWVIDVHGIVSVEGNPLVNIHNGIAVFISLYSHPQISDPSIFGVPQDEFEIVCRCITFHKINSPEIKLIDFEVPFTRKFSLAFHIFLEVGQDYLLCGILMIFWNYLGVFFIVSQRKKGVDVA
jgi:hypothetical protein